MNKQIYADYHFHTDCSPDSIEPLENQIKSAFSRGVTMLCPTDHWDLVDEESPTLSPCLADWLSKNQKQVLPPDLSLYFGVEVGEGYVRPDAVEKMLAQHPFDFVIGSVHAINCSDFAQGTSIYHGMASCKTHADYTQFFDDYFKALLKQSQETFFDSLAHINYPFRYLPEGSPISLSSYLEETTAVLENLLKKDKVFEINTTRGQTVDLWAPILKRYKEMGGKYVTIGSDSHRKDDMSLGIPEAVALLKSQGFSSYAVFQKRQLQEIPIL